LTNKIKQSKIDEACDRIKSILRLTPPQCGHKSCSSTSLCVSSTQKVQSLPIKYLANTNAICKPKHMM
jgi:hypothetical protein